MQDTLKQHEIREKPDTAVPSVTDVSPPVDARPAILVVEDDLSVRRLLQALLASADYTVRTAADGAEALASCDEHRFDAVFLDMTLPDMSGYDVLAALRKMGDMPAVVLLTGDHDAVRRARAVGAAAALPKPFDIDDLLATAARVVHR